MFYINSINVLLASIFKCLSYLNTTWSVYMHYLIWILTINSMRQVLLLSLFCKWESWGLEIRELVQSTGIKGKKPDLKPREAWGQSLCSRLLWIAPLYISIPEPAFKFLNVMKPFNYRLELKGSVLFSFLPFPSSWPSCEEEI